MSKKNIEPLTCVLDRFEEYKAVLVFSIGRLKQELILPKRYLPKGVTEGEILHLQFLTDKVAKDKQTKLAREILAEILKGGR